MNTSNLYNTPCSPRLGYDSFQESTNISKGLSFTLDQLNFTNVEREHFTDISSIPRVQDVTQHTIHKFTTDVGSWNHINQSEIERITRYYVPKQLSSSATERPNNELEKLRLENKVLKKCIEEKDDLLKGYSTKAANLESQVAITWDLTEKLKRVSKENEELTETLQDRLGAFKGTLKQLENLEAKLKIANQEKVKFQNLLEEKLKELEESKTEKIQLQKLFANKSQEVESLNIQLTETEDKLVVSTQEHKRMAQSLVSSPLNRNSEGSIKSFIVGSPKNNVQGQKSASPKKVSKTPKGSQSPSKNKSKEPKSKGVKILQILQVHKPRAETSPSPTKKNQQHKSFTSAIKNQSSPYLKRDFLNISCKTASSTRANSPKSISFMCPSPQGFISKDDSPKSSVLRSSASFLCASPSQENSSSNTSASPSPTKLSEDKKFSQRISMLAELEEQETEQQQQPAGSRIINRRETVPVFNHPIKEEDGEDFENTHRDYQQEFKRLVNEINTKVGIIWSENEVLDKKVAAKNQDIKKLEGKIAEIGVVEEKMNGILEEKKNLAETLEKKSQEVDNLKTELTESKTSQEGYKQYILEREKKQSLLAQKLNEAEAKMRGLSKVEGELRSVVNRAQSVLISGGGSDRFNTSLLSKYKSKSFKDLEDDSSSSAYNLKPLTKSTLIDLETERARTMKDLECISPLLTMDYKNLPELFIKRGNETAKSQSSLYSETSTQSGVV